MSKPNVADWRFWLILVGVCLAAALLSFEQSGGVSDALWKGGIGGALVCSFAALIAWLSHR